MFVTLFFVTFLVAALVSGVVAWISKDPIDSVLGRYFAPHISAAMSKYLRFAVVVGGMATGTRAQAREGYMSAPSWSKSAMNTALTPEVWAVEIYRTAVASVVGILWLTLLFAFLVAVGLFFIRKSNLKQLLSSP